MSPPQPASRGTRNPRALRWAWGVGAVVVMAIGLILLLLLTQSTNNRELYERNYARLFAVNVVVAAVLFAVIAWMAVRLLIRLRRGKFGSRLLVKLATIFALVGLMPGLLIYVVSYQFVSRSIESWFDVKVEGALDAGVNLGRTTLDILANGMADKARSAGSQLADIPDAAAGLTLERIRDQLDANDVVLWSASGQLIASVGQSRFLLNPERPSPQQLRNVRSQRAVAAIEGLDETGTAAESTAHIKALALVSSRGLGLLAEPRFLQVVQALPPALVANAMAVQTANREYQERALARSGLKRMYIGTLTLSLFLAVFGAVLLAVLLGNQLARPLLLLAEGVRQVAEGDLTPKAVLQGRDELGGLTRSFANMTQQLADARSAVDHSMAQVNAARANLQTILDNLTAGVIVLDAQGLIQSSNPGATRILRVPLAAFEGRPLAEVPSLEDFAKRVNAQFDVFLSEQTHHGLDHWQQSFELNATASPFSQDAITLVARGAELPGSNRLLVFDDISEIVSAQRAQAWGEVARRLAHEIKNPLTPIQLSAERMEMKLLSKLADPEQALLKKSVKTIVDQVDAMKRLVNEFRDYARLPAAELKPLDLNALVQDVLQLYENDAATVRITSELDALCPPILGDAEQLRQVIHNLLQNAQDASEATRRPDFVPEVSLRTQWVSAAQRVRLVVRDQGTGFPDHILKRAFEPYVTTKSRGTGLGLAVVKKIADEHGARIDVSNRVVDGAVDGAQVSLSFAIETSVAG
ncbi:nitrogen fixation/metabolism regulation signal transduction histidine kinase [Rhodoferax ferrireducens]|uniref:histidine kinase n=1 Tax=Rhodoferax ferrireducens TaxID=192843 RepID=A0ABU2CGK1_9BURK|nr:ATP-binding protein [Rhodoferax ferrireducens]MDR7380461.1 nitrogen fixation/metabolism regulation signal transduction histidine kinase [Rhodoferax ferrireducens]